MRKYETVVVTHDSNQTLKDDLEFIKGSDVLITNELEELEAALLGLDLDKDKNLKYRWLRLELYRLQKS